MRKLSINIPMPDRGDFVRGAAKTNNGVRTVRSWLAHKIEPKQAKPAKKAKAKEKS